MAIWLGLPGWAGTRKVRPIWNLLKQETVSGSGTGWDSLPAVLARMLVTQELWLQSVTQY